MDTTIVRCDWVRRAQPFYQEYHDSEWGVPVYEDRKLFEMLILEGAQAGLSWEIILKRRKVTGKRLKISILPALLLCGMTSLKH